MAGVKLEPSAEAAASSTGRGRGRPRRGSLLGGILAGLAVLAVASICIGLGLWQLDRREQRRAQNARLAEASKAPPIPLDRATIARIAADPAAFQYRRVQARGFLEPGREVILRGRSLNGQPGVHLLATLRLEGLDRVTLVNLGWLPAADAVTVDPRPFAAAGTAEIEGFLQPFPAAAGAGAPRELVLEDYSVLTLMRLDSHALQAHAGGVLLPFYIQQLPSPGLAEPPVRLPLPPQDEGPHLGYALQWFGIAGVFLIGFAIVAAGRGRRR
jgi:surfeit locus 1 family protein